MRKSLLARACAVAIGGSAYAQFASDRLPVPPSSPTAPKAPAPQLPGGIIPAGGTSGGTPGKSVPGGFVLNGQTLDPTRRVPNKPVPTTIDAKAPPHEWAVKATHGGWMIMVKSYAGPDSKDKAVKLAKDIRDTHGVQALLFERNAEERREEQAQLEAIRKRENEKVDPFNKLQDQIAREAEATGSRFIPTTPTVKVPRPYQETPEQWVVFVGGFKTMEDARANLPTLKKWPAPKDVSLMDTGLIGGEQTDPRTGKSEYKASANSLNPYPSSMVVPNPAATRASLEEKAKLEPFVVKLNEGVENSLLAVKKPWTLAVKSYTMPTTRASAEGDGRSVFDMKKKGTTALDRIRAIEVESEALARALRDKGMKPHPFEAFVLHHTHGSIVTVGQFDSPDDPDLLKLQQELLGLTFELRDKNQKPVLGPDGKPQVQRLFDGVNLFPVPKY